ncbi:hypothetical protein Pmar_PMAR018512 [Perkinsus marinus ATCC 50983]|uniref:RNA-editing substrate-binding complex 6 protein domain-containing protein n=1 Tax=Perkinsus marinus (strain ATCC 50983 / TXsc) TaxID=423536 RepID=C5L010_PERM5|nr:hypothetical protein Pmar_PMAR018512 [Perkinsus marinus ATCC 50983]EER09868.1 hypothetical protein Pmar_PMAR018512 [Perkinsus marinus ATCC 50983]|eukprot:XP_002778073.1 hypothetical protein Pmar_PMAR018512 [Perkinsus marinus ATCC 50983]
MRKEVLSAVAMKMMTGSTAKGSSAIDLKDLSRCLHAVAKNGDSNGIGKLVGVNLDSRSVSYGNAQDCAMAAGALAKAGSSVETRRLMAKLARRSVEVSEDFTPQGIAMLCNAYAKAGVREGESLIRFLVPNIVLKAAEFTGVDCAIVLNAFARLKIKDEPALQRLSKRVTELLRENHGGGNSLGRVATQSLNAMAKLNYIDAGFIRAILVWCEKESTDIARWSPQDMSLFCHGIVRVGGRPSKELISRLAETASSRISEFDGQAICLVWGALADLEVPLSLVRNVFEVGSRRLAECRSKSAKDAVYSLHAMAKVGYYDWAFLETVVVGSLSGRMGALVKHSQLIAMLSPDIATYLTGGQPTERQRVVAEEFLANLVELLQSEPSLMGKDLTSGQLAMFLLGLARCNHSKAVEFASGVVPLIASKMAPVSGDTRPLAVVLTALALLDFTPQKALLDLLGKAYWERVDWLGDSVQQIDPCLNALLRLDLVHRAMPLWRGLLKSRINSAMDHSSIAAGGEKLAIAAHAVSMATGVLPRVFMGALVHLDEVGCRQVLGALLGSGVRNLDALPLATLRDLIKAEAGTPRSGNGRIHSEVGTVLELQMGLPVVSEAVVADLFLVDLLIDVSDYVDVS